jgi:hypothetical protein
MLPRLSVDILASAASRSRRVAPRQTNSGFEGKILSFSSDSTLPLSGTAHVDDRRSAAGTLAGIGLSQHPSGVFVQPTTMFFHNFGPPIVNGQQEGATRNGRSPSISHVDAGTTTLAYSVLSPHTNKYAFISSRSTSIPSATGRNVEHRPKLSLSLMTPR